MERSTRQLYNRWDTGPITSALNARMPSRGIGPTQRSELTSDETGGWDSLRSTVNRTLSTMQYAAKPLLSTNPSGASSSIGSAYNPSTMYDGGSSWTPNPNAPNLQTAIKPLNRGGGSPLWGDSMGSTGGSPLSRFNQQSNQRINAAALARQMAAQQQTQTGGGATPGGIGNPSGGAWANVNQWNSFVAQAASQTGVPANVIKAIMMIESGGNPNVTSPQGYRGLMQLGPTSSNAGSIDWNRIYDPAYNILKGAEQLMQKRAAARSFFGREPSWAEVAGFYFGWVPGTGQTDAMGTTTEAYMSRFTQNMNELNAATSGGWSGQSGGGAGALSTMFPGATGEGWAFGRETGISGTYQYGTSYGLNGTVHTGLDVPMPLGTAFYAPANAVVSCIGCYRNDHITNGIGRIELTMPDGAKILYDHTYGAAAGLQVGQRVNAGQLLGYSGGMTYPHTHLEVRYPDSGTSSGYRLIDPAQYFSGMAGAPNFGGQQQQTTFRGNESSTDLLRRLMGW